MIKRLPQTCHLSLHLSQSNWKHPNLDYEKSLCPSRPLSLDSPLQLDPHQQHQVSPQPHEHVLLGVVQSVEGLALVQLVWQVAVLGHRRLHIVRTSARTVDSRNVVVETPESSIGRKRDDVRISRRESDRPIKSIMENISHLTTVTFCTLRIFVCFGFETVLIIAFSANPCKLWLAKL